MNVSIHTTKLKKALEEVKSIKKTFGEKRSKNIIRCLNFLVDVPCVADIPIFKPFRRHELSGKRKGEFAIDVDEQLRIIFKPDHDPVPLLPDGGIDIKQVTSIEIMEIEDYH